MISHRKHSGSKIIEKSFINNNEKSGFRVSRANNRDNTTTNRLLFSKYKLLLFSLIFT